MSDVVARVRDLRIRFGGHEAVRGVSFEVMAGECLALVGESGSGKSITSRSLLGQVPEAGTVSATEISVVGEDATNGDEKFWQQVRGRRVGLVAQDALVSLDGLRRVGREVGEVLEVHNRREGSKIDRAELRSRVEQELERVAVPQPAVRARQYPHELSGGLRQRALVAAATIASPQLLIADEPTTALDLRVQAQLLDLLDELKTSGMGLLLISHDLAVVSRIANRVAIMRSGEIVETGPTAEVLRDPQHEYTRTLLAATPSLHARGARLSPLAPLTFPAELAPSRRDGAVDGPVVSVRRVSQSFSQPDGSRLQAVDDVSFELAPGKTIGIVGESGSGKTTLGRIILGLQQPDAGEVLIDGGAWSQLPEKDRRKDRHVIQAIYQDPLSSFDPRHKVGAILREALALSGVPRGERVDRAVELASHVGLSPDLLARRPLNLSGGERQRVAIARALARNPRVLLCDEPVSALDVSIQAQVLDVFADVQRDLGVAMVFISHDLSVVHHVSDEVVVMKDGQVVEQGSSDQVFLSPQHEYTQALLSALPLPELSPLGRELETDND